MKRVVVTGASGFIGSHVVSKLAQQGLHVIATGRSITRLATHARHAQCVCCDLASHDLGELLRGADAVVHCAALSSPWGTAAEFNSANVIATERLAQASIAAGVSRFVHLSSPSIYFDYRHRLDIPETFQPRAQANEYARTKWLAEQRVLQAHRNGLPVIVLRPRAVFGERDTAIMPRIIKTAERGTFPLFGGGRAHIDVTYVGNVAEAVWQCLQAPSQALGKSFNITNGTPIEVRTLLRSMFDALSMQVRMVKLPISFGLGLAALLEQVARLQSENPEPRLTRYAVGVLGYSQTLDISQARRVLQYQPRWTVEQGVQLYAHWYRGHAAH